MKRTRYIEVEVFGDELEMDDSSFEEVAKEISEVILQNVEGAEGVKVDLLQSLGEVMSSSDTLTEIDTSILE